MILGTRIKQLRKEKGLTQEQLANLINVTKVSICCYEKGNRTPNLETFMDLVNVLGTTPNYLLGADTKVVKEDDEEYSVYLPKEDIQILMELRKKEELMNFLREDPTRKVEYLSLQSKKIIGNM